MQKAYKVLISLCFLCISCTGCGYSSEQLSQISYIKEFSRSNAVKYIQDKYGFKADVKSVMVEFSKSSSLLDFSSDPTGNACVSMTYKDDDFVVYINGLGDDFESFSYDNYQYRDIKDEIKKDFDCYDIQLKYGSSCNDDSITGLVHTLFDGNNFKAVLCENNSTSSEAEFIYVDSSIKDFDVEKANSLGILNGVAIDFISKGAYDVVDDKMWALSNNYNDLGSKSIFVNDYKTFYSHQDSEYKSCTKFKYDGITYISDDISVDKIKDFDLGTLKKDYDVEKERYAISSRGSSLSIFIPHKKVSDIKNPFLVYSYNDKKGNSYYSSVLLCTTDDKKYVTANIYTRDRYNIKIALAKRAEEE